MNTVIINPGSGDVQDGGFEQAFANIKVFMEDSEIPLFVEKANTIPEENGRYLLTLKTPLTKVLSWEVEMPALPIDQVRYIDSEKQNIWDFPRLYVDGSSWVWMFATIKKSHIIGFLESQIEDFEHSIEKTRTLIEHIKILQFSIGSESIEP